MSQNGITPTSVEEEQAHVDETIRRFYERERHDARFRQRAKAAGWWLLLICVACMAIYYVLWGPR